MDTAPVYTGTAITCPKCGANFINNTVNGMALIHTVSSIDSRKRMYCKLSLDDLERISTAKGHIDFIDAKKILLDNFNDFVRDIQTILGIGTEAE